MRIARIWKRSQTLFFPGWVATVVGGTVLVYLLIFVSMMPWGQGDYVDVGQLPANPNEAAPSTEAEPRIDLLPNGSIRTEGWSPGRPCRIHIHRDAQWISIRDLLRQLRADGLKTVLIVVRNRDGTASTLPFDLEGPWPDLKIDAPAQAFVDALR
ncbi:MAG: hypothetical protein ACYTHK_18165 [Planctomycetota bacterium]|jgi:hypothetical protein